MIGHRHKTGMRTRLALGMIAGLLATNAFAQTPAPVPATRAEEAEATRRAKAAALGPNEPTRTESILLYIEDTRLVGRIFNPPAGWFVEAAGLAEGSGLAAGGGYRFGLGAAGTIDAHGLISLNQSFLADVTWRSTLDPSARIAASVSAGQRRDANQLFHGIGPGTTKDLDGEFGLDNRRIEGRVNVRPTSWLSMAAGTGYRRLSLRNLDLEDDRHDEVDDEEQPPIDPLVWFGVPDAPELRDQPTLADVNLGATVDTRDAVHGGGTRLAVRRTWYRDRGSSTYDFHSTRVELQQFVPIFSATRVFALSAIADEARPESDARVPFYLQPSLGGSRSLRGFMRQRFRDTRSLLLQAEYRYAINSFISGAIFVDSGQVAPTWRMLRMDTFQQDVGLGLRIGYGPNAALRADFAVSREGPRLIVSGSGVF